MAEMSNPVDVMGRELPYSQEAELAVIGSALTNSHSVAESVEILRPSDFYFPQNKEIFSVILDLFNENAAIDFITVSNKLSQSDKLEAVGGIAYLRNAATNVPTTRHVTYYSQIIKEKAVLRTLIKSAGDISDMAYGQNDKVERIVDQAEQLIFDVTSSNNKSDILPISEIFMGSYQELVENSLNQSGITGLPTGFDELNRRTGGFHGGELILIAGRPGMGKSSFAVNIAEHVSITDKKTVAIFNLEMPKEQIVNRIICSQALVNSNKIRTGDITGEDWEKIGAIVNRVATAPMYIDDTASITVSEIRAKCRRLKQTKNLELIVIDYLQLMHFHSFRVRLNREAISVPCFRTCVNRVLSSRTPIWLCFCIVTNIIIPIPRIKIWLNVLSQKTEAVKPVCLNLVGKVNILSFLMLNLH